MANNLAKGQFNTSTQVNGKLIMLRQRQQLTSFAIFSISDL